MKRLIVLLSFLITFCAFADEYTELEQAALAGGVSGQIASALAQKTKNAGYSKENLIRIKSLIQTAKAAEASRIAEKIAEGITKNVPEQRVMAAAEKISGRYSFARQLAEKAKISAKITEIFADSVTDALAAGAKEAGLEKVAGSLAAQNRNRDSYAIAIMDLYKEMARYGVDDGKTSDIAMKAMGKLNADQINEYRKSFAENATAKTASSFADDMGRSISRGAGASSMGSGSGGSGSGGSGGGHGGGKR